MRLRLIAEYNSDYDNYSANFCLQIAAEKGISQVAPIYADLAEELSYPNVAELLRHYHNFSIADTALFLTAHNAWRKWQTQGTGGGTSIYGGRSELAELQRQVGILSTYTPEINTLAKQADAEVKRSGVETYRHLPKAGFLYQNIIYTIRKDGFYANPTKTAAPRLNALEQRIYDTLNTETPYSNIQLSRQLGYDPQQTYRALYKLVNLGIVKNAKFDPERDYGTNFNSPGEYLKTPQKLERIQPASRSWKKTTIVPSPISIAFATKIIINRLGGIKE